MCGNARSLFFSTQTQLPWNDRLIGNLRIQIRFENVANLPACDDGQMFDGSKWPCRKAGIPLYDSNFRDRLIFYKSKLEHRKVGHF